LVRFGPTSDIALPHHRRPEIVSVAPQVFDLLEYLIRNRDRVVSSTSIRERKRGPPVVPAIGGFSLN
jgi:DNA-binding response OmpR family regulator